MEEYLELFTFSSTEKQLIQFLEKYIPNYIVIPPDTPLQNFKKRSERVCRFCASLAGEKKFKKVAHVIPEFMGNKNLQSDFECDECNSHFSKYETDLAAWLGMFRTVIGIKGKRGVPTFKSPKNLVTAQEIDFFDNKATKISSSALENHTIKVDRETGKTEIIYTKEPYTPIKVYKSLLKIALSIIGEEDIEQYRFALNYLQNDSPNIWCDEFAKVNLLTLPMEHRFIKPFGFLFKKQSDDAKLPMHVFMFYFQTYIFSFPLPFNKLDCDKGLYNDLVMNIEYPPVILFNKPTLQSIHHSRLLDFTGYEKIIGEEGIISFEAHPDSLKNGVIFDPKTGKSSPGSLDADKIISLIFAPEDSVLRTEKRNDKS